MTRSLRRHYRSCGKCHGNERLKRKAFRRLRKTDIEGADVTCCGRLFHVRAAATGKARSPRNLPISVEFLDVFAEFLQDMVLAGDMGTNTAYFVRF